MSYIKIVKEKTQQGKRKKKIDTFRYSDKLINKSEMIHAQQDGINK